MRTPTQPSFTAFWEKASSSWESRFARSFTQTEEIELDGWWHQAVGERGLTEDLKGEKGEDLFDEEFVEVCQMENEC